MFGLFEKTPAQRNAKLLIDFQDSFSRHCEKHADKTGRIYTGGDSVFQVKEVKDLIDKYDFDAPMLQDAPGEKANRLAQMEYWLARGERDGTDGHYNPYEKFLEERFFIWSELRSEMRAREANYFDSFDFRRNAAYAVLGEIRNRWIKEYPDLQRRYEALVEIHGKKLSDVEVEYEHWHAWRQKI